MTDSVTSSSVADDESSYNPRYSSFESLRYRKSRRGPTERFRHERERYYTNTPHSTLIKMLIEEEYESKKVRKLLDAALEQLETYAEHLKTAEGEQHIALSHIQSLVNVQNEAAAARQKAALYEMQFHNAKQELEKATAIISTLEKQRNEAEAQATNARATARKLNEERLTFMAREQGKREGFEEGLRLGKEAALADFAEEQRLLEYERRSRIDEASPRGAYIEEQSVGATPSPHNTPLARQRTTSTTHRTPLAAAHDPRPTVESDSDGEDTEQEYTPSPAPPPPPHPAPTPPSPLQHPARDRVRSMEVPKRPSSAGSGSARSSRTSETSSSARRRVVSTSTSRLANEVRYNYPPSGSSSIVAPPPRTDYYSSAQTRQTSYSSGSDTETEDTEPPRSAPVMSQRQREKQPAQSAYMPMPMPMPRTGYSPDMASMEIQRSQTPVEVFLPHMPMPPPPTDSRPSSAAPMHRSVSNPIPASSVPRVQMPEPTMPMQMPAPTQPSHPLYQPQSQHRPSFQVEPVDRNGHGRRGSSPESLSSNATGSISHLQLLSFPSGPSGSSGKERERERGKQKKSKVLSAIPEVHDSPAAIRDYREARGHHKKSASTPVVPVLGQPRARERPPEVNGWGQPYPAHPSAPPQPQPSVYAPPTGHRQPSVYAPPPAPQQPTYPSAQAVQDRRRKEVEDWRRHTTPRQPPPEQPPFIPPTVTLTRSESLDHRRPPPGWGGEADRNFLSPMPDPSMPNKTRLTRSNSNASSTVGITIEPPSRPVSMSSSSPSTPVGRMDSFLSPNHQPAPLPAPVQQAQPRQQPQQRPPTQHYQPRPPPVVNPPSRQPSPFIPNVHEGDHILHTGKVMPTGFIPQPNMPPDPTADLAIRMANVEEASGVRDSFIARSPSAPPKPVLLRSSHTEPVIPGGFEPEPNFIPPLSPRHPSTSLVDPEGPVIPVPPPPGGADYYSPSRPENVNPLPVPSPRMAMPQVEPTVSPAMFNRVLASEHDRNDGDVPTEVDQPGPEPIRAAIGKKKKKAGKR